MIRTNDRATALLLGSILLGCGGGSGDSGNLGPEGPGLLDLQLQVPAGTVDGVALVKVSGNRVTKVLAAGHQFRVVGEGTSVAHVLVRGSLSATVTLASVCVDNLGDRTDYTLQVVQVAGGSGQGYARRDPAGYQATLENPRIVQSC